MLQTVTAKIQLTELGNCNMTRVSLNVAAVDNSTEKLVGYREKSQEILGLLLFVAFSLFLESTSTASYAG